MPHARAIVSGVCCATALCVGGLIGTPRGRSGLAGAPTTRVGGGWRGPGVAHAATSALAASGVMGSVLGWPVGIAYLLLAGVPAVLGVLMLRRALAPGADAGGGAGGVGAGSPDARGGDGPGSLCLAGGDGERLACEFRWRARYVSRSGHVRRAACRARGRAGGAGGYGADIPTGGTRRLRGRGLADQFCAFRAVGSAGRNCNCCRIGAARIG